MKTFYYRYTIGPTRGRFLVQATEVSIATAYAKLRLHYLAAGQPYFLYLLAVLDTTAYPRRSTPTGPKKAS